MNKNAVIWIALGVLVFVMLCAAVWGISTYNGLIQVDENVQTQWSNLQSAYQRRVDLYATQLPTVVAGAAQELAVFKELRKQAEALGTSLKLNTPPGGAEAEKLQQQIASFDAAAANFAVYVADNPEIVSIDLYRDFIVTIEGTENRINVARRDYNQAVRTYRTKVRAFPTAIIAGMLGMDVEKYAYFEAQGGAENAPILIFPTPAP